MPSLQIPHPLLVALLGWVLHQTWFRTNLAPHLFNVLYHLGLGRKQPGFWSESGFEHHTYYDWCTWLSCNRRIPALLAELLTCPICFAWHLSFWLALLSCFWLPVGEALQTFILSLALCVKTAK